MIGRILLLGLLLIVAQSSSAQSGVIKTDEFHFVSLEGNLVGDSPRRSILVYLPPGYERQKKIRYPVVYLLHGFNGFGVGNKTWMREGGNFNVETISRLITEKKISPMIVVMPDGSNRYGGSIYTNSITTGNWEDYIVRDLVAFIDKNYRTLARAESRRHCRPFGGRLWRTQNSDEAPGRFRRGIRDKFVLPDLYAARRHLTIADRG